MELMSNWVEKYRPNSLDEVIGNDEAIRDLKEWADTWESHKTAVILYGPAGLGKTSAAQTLSGMHGWDYIEMNASDKRTASDIDDVAGGASQNESLSGSRTRTLIVIDEADSLHGNYDRGGSKALTNVVKSSEEPIVLIANNYYDMSRSLRNACESIEFKPVDVTEIAKLLRDICESEGIEYNIPTLKDIARGSEGDVRSAINDLQAVASGKEKITQGDLITTSRDKKVDIFPFLDSLFKKGNYKEMIEESRNVDENPRDLIRWIEENVPKVYNDKELAQAYKFLSLADKWLGRVRKTQDYSYWRYASDTMVGGVAASREGWYDDWTRYSPPKWKQQKKVKTKVSRKIASKSGVSTGTATHGILPFLAAMTHHCKNRELTVKMAAYYDMDEKEVSFVTGSGETTNKVQSIVEDAEEAKSEFEISTTTGHEGPKVGLDENATDTEEEEIEKVDEEEQSKVDDTSEEEDTEEEEELQRGIDEFM